MKLYTDFTAGKELIRKCPQVIFGDNGIEGAENAFKSLLYIFSEDREKFPDKGGGVCALICNFVKSC